MGGYDVYLNAKGYHLAKNPDGSLQPNAASEQVTNPFARYLSSDEQYIRTPFRFGAGGGLAIYDGSHRYESGECIDSRGGVGVIVGEQCYTATPYSYEWNFWPTDDYNVVDNEVSSGIGGDEGMAFRFQTDASTLGIRVVRLLLRRDQEDYESAASFTVAIYSDTTGPKPNALVGSATVALNADDREPFGPWPDRWKSGEYFWLEVRFSSTITVTASTYYWLVLTNNQTYPVYWGQQNKGMGYYRSIWNGTSWANGSLAHPLCATIVGYTRPDSWPRSFCEFTGSDSIPRLYMGTGWKVQYLDDDMNWNDSKQLIDPVLDLLPFNSVMFAAQGPNQDVWYTDGSAPGAGAWTQLTGQQANALCVHDALLWKADVAELTASEDGTTTWTHGTVTVGDAGTPIQSMVSHGGKLWAAKPEGIFEISYPDTYPTTGDPVANLALDFRTEKAPRTWLLSWHSGLYFPSYGGIYEWKGGILRNVWTDKIDEGAQELAIPPTTVGKTTTHHTWTRPRRWGPIYDARPGTFTAAWASTRGIYLAHCDSGLQVSHLWFYTGRDWHDMGPLMSDDGTNAKYDLAEYCLAGYLQDRGGGKGLLVHGYGSRGTLRRYEPTWTSDRSQDSNCVYPQLPGNSTKGVVVTPEFSLDQKQAESSYIKVGVSGARGDSGNSIEILYRLNRNDAWTSIGSVTLAGTDYEEVSFPTATTGRLIQLQAKLLVPYGNTVPCRLDQLDLMYQLVPESYTTHQLIIHAAPEQDVRDGGLSQRTTDQILSDLRTLSTSAGFTYVDPSGGSHSVRITGLRVTYAHQEARPGDPPTTEAFAVLSLLEL